MYGEKMYQYSDATKVITGKKLQFPTNFNQKNDNHLLAIKNLDEAEKKYPGFLRQSILNQVISHPRPNEAASALVLLRNRSSSLAEFEEHKTYIFNSENPIAVEAMIQILREYKVLNKINIEIAIKFPEYPGTNSRSDYTLIFAFLKHKGFYNDNIHDLMIKNHDTQLMKKRIKSLLQSKRLSSSTVNSIFSSEKLGDSHAFKPPAVRRVTEETKSLKTAPSDQQTNRQSSATTSKNNNYSLAPKAIKNSKSVTLSNPITEPQQVDLKSDNKSDAFYLSPETMYKRYKRAQQKINAHNKKNKLANTLENAYQLYDVCTKQYLGLGALLQIVPGTNANKARKQLCNALEPALSTIKSEFGKKLTEQRKPHYGGLALKIRAHTSRLHSYLNLSPLYRLLGDIAYGFKYLAAATNKKSPLKRIVFELPFLSDLFYIDRKNKIKFADYPLQGLLFSILNPVRVLDQTLNFINLGINRLLEIGTKKDDTSSKFRFAMKYAIGILFGIIATPLKILMHTIDLIPLNIARIFFIDPIIHLGQSLFDAYQNRGKKLLVMTNKELQEVKELRRKAKNRPDSSYTAITNATHYTQEYIGETKEKLYSKAEKAREEKIMAIRAENKKIDKTAALLSVINLYNSHKIKDKTVEVEQARVIILS